MGLQKSPLKLERKKKKKEKEKIINCTHEVINGHYLQCPQFLYQLYSMSVLFRLLTLQNKVFRFRRTSWHIRIIWICRIFASVGLLKLMNWRQYQI